MIVADASVWVSAFLPQDVHHAASLQWFRRHIGANEQFVAPILLMVEVGGALVRHAGQVGPARRAIDALRRLPALRWVAMDDHLGISASRLAINLRLRGADAVYVAVAARLNIPLVTWDQEQITRAGGHIRVYTP